MFTALCLAAVFTAFLFARSARKHPELELDTPNRQ